MRNRYPIRYVSPSGDTLELSRRPYDTVGYTLPSWEYEAATLGRKIAGFTRDNADMEISVLVISGDADEATDYRNRLYEIPARDLASKTPGRLYFGDWYVKAFVVAAEPGNYWQARNAAAYGIRLLAVEPMWTRETTKTFLPGRSEDFLDYPHDFSYDFSSASVVDDVLNENFAPAYVRITVQGAVVHPSVTIGGNRYKVDVTLSNSEHLVIDGLSKTVEKVYSDGTRENAFALRAGEQIVGSGEYVFEKVSQGTLPVLWSGDFAFDVTIIEQRAEPRWS